ncbi:MAG: adenylate/guanylate cyclase domain-containing protein [Treponema sp.]|nr:adenylate/guanylate cyclase domain-containing protein [Treponema sp.]
MAKNKKIITAVIIVVLVFIGLGALHFLHIFDALEYKAYDFRVKLFADTYKPSDDIVVILLDQPSIDWANREHGWGWPWPRKAYADIVDYMNMGGAKSIVFDVLFSEPSIYRNANQDAIIDTAVHAMEEIGENITAVQTAVPGEEQRSFFAKYLTAVTALRSLSDRADDNVFIEAQKNYGKTVQTVFFSTQTGSSVTWPADINKPLLHPEGFSSVIEHYTLSNETDGRLGAQFPIPGLTVTAGALGNVTNSEDFDGINRRARLFINFDGNAVPGLSAASLLVSGAGSNVYFNEKKRQIEWDDYIIPVDNDGKSILRYRGSLNRYMPYSAADVLSSAEAVANGQEPVLFPGDFTDKYVFFGFYAPGLFDICANPLETVYPGMGVHITMLDNILNNDFIREAPVWLDMVVLFMIILATTALALFCDKLQFSVGGLVLIASLIIGGAFIAYNTFCLWFPMVLPLAGLFVSFLTCTVYNYATEGSQRRFIKSAFSQYLSPIYIEQLISNPDQLKLGGERAEISIFFSDVQGFTTISENLDPDQLKELLNEYLTFLTDIIQDSGGTIDKYEGDAIIAFWNAPVHMEDHASRALGAAIECQTRLVEKAGHFEDLFNKWNINASGINKRMLTRIGLNTGYAVVGNFGSEGHFNYTVLGDSVNLAARLEGLNKQFGTLLMCTGHTMNEANNYGKFYGRSLAQVTVVGKNEPVTVWEPLTEAVYREKESIIREFDSARDTFYTGDFTKALALFEKLKDRDAPPKYYIEQCRYYLENPSEWQGFWKATSK